MVGFFKKSLKIIRGATEMENEDFYKYELIKNKNQSPMNCFIFHI